MARPRKSEIDKRDERSEQRYTLGELEFIREQADRAGLSVSEFVRRRALSHPVRAVQTNATSPAVISELNRIGVNVNQLARANNRGRDFANEWANLGKSLSALLTKLSAQHGS